MITDEQVERASIAVGRLGHSVSRYAMRIGLEAAQLSPAPDAVAIVEKRYATKRKSWPNWHQLEGYETACLEILKDFRSATNPKGGA